MPQPTPTPSPQRYKRGEIQFPLGAISTKVSGKLKPRDTDVYTFNTYTGQVAKLTHQGKVSLQLTPKEKRVASRSVELPTSGIYTVDVVNQQASSAAYTLTLEIK